MPDLESSLGDNTTRVQYAKDQNKNNLVKATIIRVDPINHVMDCEIDSGGVNQIAQNIIIQGLFTDLGYGIQMIPIAFQSIAWLFKISATDWLHVGYYCKNYKDLIANETYTKEDTTENILQRYVNQGEVHISSAARNEIFLSNDGSIFFRAQYGAFLKLDNQEHRLEGNFANLKYEMDGVRIRAGNSIRPVGSYFDQDDNEIQTNEDEHIIMFNGDVIKESYLETLDEEGENITEFFVQVGTNIDAETGVDMGTPSVGIIAMGDIIVDEKGQEISSANKSLNFIVKNAAGGGIAIDEDGSFLILDQKGGSVTKFTSGPTGEKSFRIGNNLISVDINSGIVLEHETGSSFTIDKSGNINMDHSSGNSFAMDESGLNISAPKGAVNISADKIILNGNLSVGGIPIDAPFPAMLGATSIDLTILTLVTQLITQFALHMHPTAAPGPPSPPVAPLVLAPIPILPQVMSGVLQAAQFNIS